MVAVGGFAVGALAGRWMMAEMRTALSAVQMRLSALEQKVIGASATPSSTAVPNTNHSVAPVAPTAAAAQAAALEHHAAAVEKLAAAVDKHAQAVDDHGAATVAAAVEMGSHPAAVAPIATAATFATPLHAAGVVMGASVAPAAAAVVAAAPQS